eukprot:gene37692-49364_t
MEDDGRKLGELTGRKKYVQKLMDTGPGKASKNKEKASKASKTSKSMEDPAKGNILDMLRSKLPLEKRSGAPGGTPSGNATGKATNKEEAIKMQGETTQPKAIDQDQEYFIQLPGKNEEIKEGKNEKDIGRLLNSKLPEEYWAINQDQQGDQAQLSLSNEQQMAQEMESEGNMDIIMVGSKQRTESYDSMEASEHDMSMSRSYDSMEETPLLGYASPDLATAMLQARIRQEPQTTAMMVYEEPRLLCSVATRQTNDAEDLIPDSISEEVENVVTNEISMDMDGYSMTEESRAALRHQDNNIITQEIERIIPIDGLRTKEEEI